jgi:hypothetical protein
MAISNYYASIAVVEIHADSTVTIESVSVTSGECVLSGAWEFQISDSENIQNVLSGKLIIPLGNLEAIKKLVGDSQVAYIEAGPFLADAREAASEALAAYEAFKSENPTKRKKLVSPDFYYWPETIDFNVAAKYLESIGKMATPVGTPEGFRKTLSAARLLKHLVDMWQLDEQERNNRKYVEGEKAEITILPESWLSKLVLVQAV